MDQHAARCQERHFLKQSAEVVGLSPEGRGVLEALVTIPNDYLDQIPAPDAQDLRALEELSPTGAAVSKK